MGYGWAHYSDFFDIQHVLLLTGCTFGNGGNLLLEDVKKVFATEFPLLLEKFELHLPDENARRVGQSIVAASLPIIK